MILLIIDGKVFQMMNNDDFNLTSLYTKMIFVLAYSIAIFPAHLNTKVYKLKMLKRFVYSNMHSKPFALSSLFSRCQLYLPTY